MRSITQHTAALLAAAVTTGALASIVQTQVDLAALAGLGASVTAAIRVRTTLEDLAGFGPLMSAIAIAALLPAFAVAHLLMRWVPQAGRGALFAFAAVCGLCLAFWLMHAVIPMPALPGTRGPFGHLLLSLTGVAGGLLYARASRAAPESARRRRHAWTAAALALVPAIAFVVMAPRAGEQPPRADPASYRVETVATGLERPWSVAFLPDGRRLVTEMGGRLLAIAADGAVSTIALDGLPPAFSQGRVAGLMEVMPDPRFAENGWIYLTMGYGEAGANGTRLVRARLAGARIENVRILFSSTLKERVGNNGGRLAFLADGTLLLTIGDGNLWREQAQNLGNHLGKVVRVDREGRAPADNPFVKRPGAAPEVYSLGHRNPQGIAVDPVTGGVLLTEHGPRGGDEINHVVAGANYGWPVVSGGVDYPFARVTPFRRLAGYRDALLEWTPSIAPAGLAVVDGGMFPAWRGDLLVPALKERALRRVLRDGGRIVGQQLLLAELGERMRDVKVAPDGSIYVLTDGVDARLLRLVPASVLVRQEAEPR